MKLLNPSRIPGSFCFLCMQAATKKVVGLDEWEKKLKGVVVRKEDMNKLIMNFLVFSAQLCHGMCLWSGVGDKGLE